MEKIYDAIVIGAGPAGISAALYLKRARLDVAVVFKGMGALEKAELIENYYGLAEPVPGPELFQNGLDQASALGIPLIIDEVLRLSWDAQFNIEAKSGSYAARAVVIATGSARKTLPIPGLADFEGKGVSYCAVCDAFFYKDKDVAVLGSGEFAHHEANELAATAKSVTILTNGKRPQFSNEAGYNIIDTEIDSLRGEDTLASVVLKDSREIAVSGLFVALGVAGAAEFARAAGAAVDAGVITVDDRMQTTIPGLFAAGDCVGGLLQASAAVGEGAIAAMGAIEFVRGLKKAGK